MAIKTLTYRDLTDSQRRTGANRMREKLLGVLNNPFMTPDQQKAIFEKVDLLVRWEKLQIDVGTPIASPPHQHALPSKPPVQALPQHHAVVIKETVNVQDKAK